MFLILPFGTDNPHRRRPLVNYALIAANILIFILTYHPHQIGSQGLPAALRDAVSHLKLDPTAPHLYQFITYAFLHGSWAHLLGNMLFLYIFGNSVNDRLGHAGYLMFYLAGAVASAAGFCFFSHSPIIGASGAIAAVTGAYMVLFPQTSVHTFYWIIFFIGSANFPALYFILFKLIAYDNIIEPNLSGPGNVAYEAHLAGYAFGVGVPLLLIALKLLPHSPFDLWALVRRWRRRTEYRRMVNQGFEPFESAGRGRRSVPARVVSSSTPKNPHADEIMDLRARIAHAATDFDTAAHLYLQLLQLDPKHSLPEQPQLDVANKLMQLGRYDTAAQAYENFLNAYPRYPMRDQVQLMLGLVYARYLHQPENARLHLAAALEKLGDENQRTMAQDELKRLQP